MFRITGKINGQILIKTFSVFIFFVFTSLIAYGQRNVVPQNSDARDSQPGIGLPGNPPIGIMVASFTKEELIGKSTFFKGDSLAGFNYESTAIQLEKGGYKLLGEFCAMMYRAQEAFVKNKYRISVLPYETNKKPYTPPATLASSCDNLDFEDGNFGTWTITSGINQNSNGNLTLKGPGFTSTNQDIYSCNDVNLITAAYGNDPIGFPGVYPSGGSYSARVGGFNINASSGYGFGCSGYHWTTGSFANGEVMEKSYAVTSANDLLSYNYAVVLNDGGHANGQQPYFHVYVKDLAGTVLSTCTQYYVQAAAGGPPAGFINSGYVNTYDNSIFYYKGWTSNSINLSAYIGQTVKISFVAAGCTPGAHPGWAYVDATCAAAQITTSNALACAGSTPVLTAPPVQGGAYSWSGPGIVGATNTQTVTANANGTYSVTVTPSQGPGCAYTLAINVNFVSVAAPVSASANVSCFGGTNGSVTVNPSGGSPSYSYAWTPSGGNAQTASNLTAGNYTVTVTDANGCTQTSTVAITQPTTALSSTVASTAAGCTVANGSATAGAAGGTPVFSYSWSPGGQNTQTATGLASGNYVVTVTDSQGCTTSSNITVGITASPSTTASSTQSTCGLANGTSTANPSGGTPGYSYAWSNGQTTQTATGLAVGNYIVTVTDVNGCTTTAPVTISQPAALTLSTTQTNVLCNGGNNGSTTATPAGGTPGYAYQWSPSGGNAATANNLAAGTYQCIITDANGCTSITSVTITEPAPVTLAISGNDSACMWNNTVLAATPTGGTPGYTYVWSPGGANGSSITVSPTASTSYSVTMTDANGCISILQTFNLTVNPGPTALFNTTQASGNFSSTYTFTDQSSGANSWLWMFGDNSGNSTAQNPVHTFPGAGTYTVTQVVFNKFGCSDTFKITINIEPGILIPNVFTPNGDGHNEEWYIPNSGVKDFHVIIFDRWGLRLFETTADEIRWDGRSSGGSLLADGTYYYSLTAILKSFNGDVDYSTTGYVTLLTTSKH